MSPWGSRERRSMRTQSRWQTLSQAPLSWEQPLEVVNCLRLKGWQVPRRKETTSSSKGAGGGRRSRHSPGSGQHSQLSNVGTEEPSTLGHGQAAPQGTATRAEICAHGFHMSEGETWILSCHLPVAKPELPWGAASAGPRSWLLPGADQAEGWGQI